MLRNVSFALKPGQTLALVGESGSGKSVTSLAIMGLLPANASVRGQIRFLPLEQQPVQLTQCSPAQWRALRGARLAMIFQEPMSSLNPLFTIGDQIGEMLLLHSDLDRQARRQRVLQMLELVEIPGAATRFDSYPHEFSGGQRQRIGIARARALALEPEFIVADESVSALDVSIQVQVLNGV